MALKKRRDGLVTADAPTTTTPFDIQAFIRDKDREIPGFAAAVEAELSAMKLEERLRDLRKGQKTTQAQLAKRMGMTQGAVAQLEKTEPGSMAIRTLTKMATALGYKLRIDFEQHDRTVFRAAVPGGVIEAQRKAPRHPVRRAAKK